MTARGAGDTVARIAAAARGLFPSAVSIAALDPRLPQPDLLPEEEPAIANAIERRRREFAAGRAAARRGLASLGLPGRAVPMGSDRAPLWPEGVVGSIAHSDEICLAAVARSDQVLTLGIDVEPDLPLDEALWSIVLTGGELAWLAGRVDETRGRLARLIFSAKESAYKAQHPLTGVLCDFKDMQVSLDEGSKTYQAVFLRDIGVLGCGTSLCGRFARSEAVVITAVTRTPRL